MKLVGGLLDFHDKIQIESLDHRLTRNKVVTSNISNAETPGFRAIGYGFEDQLQALAGRDEPFPMKATHDRHFKNEHVLEDGTLQPDVFVRPTESISEDGNTVDMDMEMASLTENQTMYRATIDLLNKKLGIIRYAISNGGR
jgi:flagellar basal-body rod protein FlgB